MVVGAVRQCEWEWARERGAMKKDAKPRARVARSLEQQAHVRYTDGRGWGARLGVEEGRGPTTVGPMRRST